MRTHILALAVALLATPVAAQDAKVTGKAGDWSYPHVCFVDGKAFSVGAQTCNKTRGKSGNRLLQCEAGEKPDDPATWRVVSHDC